MIQQKKGNHTLISSQTLLTPVGGVIIVDWMERSEAMEDDGIKSETMEEKENETMEEKNKEEEEKGESDDQYWLQLETPDERKYGTIVISIRIAIAINIIQTIVIIIIIINIGIGCKHQMGESMHSLSSASSF